MTISFAPIKTKTKKEHNNVNTKSLQTLAYETNISQFTLE